MYRSYAKLYVQLVCVFVNQTLTTVTYGYNLLVRVAVAQSINQLGTA